MCDKRRQPQALFMESSYGFLFLYGQAGGSVKGEYA